MSKFLQRSRVRPEAVILDDLANIEMDLAAANRRIPTAKKDRSFNGAEYI
jgi:hypothetical protein